MIMDDILRPLLGVAFAVTWTDVPTPAPFDGEVMVTPAKDEVAIKATNAVASLLKICSK
jgi:hypothetical protein